MAYVVRAGDHVVASGSIMAAGQSSRIVRTAVVAYPKPAVLLQRRPDGTGGEGDETVLQQTDGFKSARVFTRAQGVENQMQQRRAQHQALAQVERNKVAGRRVVAEQDVERLNEQLLLVERAEKHRKLQTTTTRAGQNGSSGGGGSPWQGQKMATTKDLQLAKLMAEKRLEAAFEREFMVARPPQSSDYTQGSTTPMSTVKSANNDAKSRLAGVPRAGEAYPDSLEGTSGRHRQHDEKAIESTPEEEVASSLEDSRVTYTSAEGGGGGWQQLQPMTPPAPTAPSATLSSRSRDSSRVSSPAMLMSRDRHIPPARAHTLDQSDGGDVQEDSLAMSGTRERAALIRQSFTAALDSSNDRSSLGL